MIERRGNCVMGFQRIRVGLFVSIISVWMPLGVSSDVRADWFSLPKIGRSSGVVESKSNKGFNGTIRKLMQDAKSAEEQGNLDRAITLADRATTVAETSSTFVKPASELSSESTSRYANQLRLKKAELSVKRPTSDVAKSQKAATTERKEDGSGGTSPSLIANTQKAQRMGLKDGTAPSRIAKPQEAEKTERKEASSSVSSPSRDAPVAKTVQSERIEPAVAAAPAPQVTTNPSKPTNPHLRLSQPKLAVATSREIAPPTENVVMTANPKHRVKDRPATAHAPERVTQDSQEGMLAIYSENPSKTADKKRKATSLPPRASERIRAENSKFAVEIDQPSKVRAKSTLEKKRDDSSTDAPALALSATKKPLPYGRDLNTELTTTKTPLPDGRGSATRLPRRNPGVEMDSFVGRSETLSETPALALSSMKEPLPDYRGSVTELTTTPSPLAYDQDAEAVLPTPNPVAAMDPLPNGRGSVNEVPALSPKHSHLPYLRGVDSQTPLLSSSSARRKSVKAYVDTDRTRPSPRVIANHRSVADSLPARMPIATPTEAPVTITPQSVSPISYQVGEEPKPIPPLDDDSTSESANDFARESANDFAPGSANDLAREASDETDSELDSEHISEPDSNFAEQVDVGLEADEFPAQKVLDLKRRLEAATALQPGEISRIVTADLHDNSDDGSQVEAWEGIELYSTRLSRHRFTVRETPQVASTPSIEAKKPIVGKSSVIQWRAASHTPSDTHTPKVTVTAKSSKLPMDLRQTLRPSLASSSESAQRVGRTGTSPSITTKSGRSSNPDSGSGTNHAIGSPHSGASTPLPEMKGLLWDNAAAPPTDGFSGSVEGSSQPTELASDAATVAPLPPLDESVEQTSFLAHGETDRRNRASKTNNELRSTIDPQISHGAGKGPKIDVANTKSSSPSSAIMPSGPVQRFAILFGVSVQTAMAMLGVAGIAMLLGCLWMIRQSLSSNKS